MKITTVISLLFLVKLVSARYAFIPKFFAQDSAVIVDTDKQLPPSSQHMKPHRVHYRPMHYPVYHIIPQVPATASAQFKEFTKSVESIAPVTSTTTPATIFTKDEFPADLLEIAQKKLGIKSMDEIPSISELGELLGTESAKETIDYIRELTSTEDGIALVKAYIESSDYTDSTGTITSTTSTVAPPTTTPTTITTEINFNEITKTEPSFFERMSAYLNIFDLFPSAKKDETIEKDLHTVDRVSEMGKPIPAIFNNLVHVSPSEAAQKPLLVRNPLPYHYPIPIRPVVIYRPRTPAQPSSPNSLQSVVHLNTPRLVVPQVSSPASTTKKSAKSETPQKQKHFSELAEKVANFPLTHDRDALIDAQYAAAIEKAIEQDEDLRKILSSTETLK